MANARYQLRCPKCNHEFTYDNGYYDEHIARLGVEIREITEQLQAHKLLTHQEQMERTDWWRRTKLALTRRQKDLAELKAVRKVADQQIKAYEHLAFKQAVKERCGEDAYREMIAQAEETVEAYKISGLMRHEYTRSAAKSNIASINKL